MSGRLHSALVSNPTVGPKLLFVLVSVPVIFFPDYYPSSEHLKRSSSVGYIYLGTEPQPQIFNNVKYMKRRRKLTYAEKQLCAEYSTYIVSLNSQIMRISAEIAFPPCYRKT